MNIVIMASVSSHKHKNPLNLSITIMLILCDLKDFILHFFQIQALD